MLFSPVPGDQVQNNFTGLSKNVQTRVECIVYHHFFVKNKTVNYISMQELRTSAFDF